MAAIIQETSVSSPYSSNDIELINSSQIESFFNPSVDYIEFVVNSPNNSYQDINYDYKNYIYPTDGTVISESTSQLEINPSADINRLGITGGEYNLYYNFLKNELLTNYNNQDLFIKNISADRTELIVRYKSNIDSSLIVNDFISNNTSFYFNDFYLNFGDNVLIVANNIEVNSSNGEILINLYNPLPNNINVNTPFCAFLAGNGKGKAGVSNLAILDIFIISTLTTAVKNKLPNELCNWEANLVAGDNAYILPFWFVESIMDALSVPVLYPAAVPLPLLKPGFVVSSLVLCLPNCLFLESVKVNCIVDNFFCCKLIKYSSPVPISYVINSTSLLSFAKISDEVISLELDEVRASANTVISKPPFCDDLHLK